MRSHYCDQIDSSLIGQTVRLCGWVHRRRDHGGLVFIDLRDRQGLVQVVCDPQQAQAFEQAQTLRNEYVILVNGNIRTRPEGTVNANLKSGEVELLVESIEILNSSAPLPFNVDDYQEVGEETRLRYRYIDLRRPEIAKRFIQRAKITGFIRSFMDNNNFLDIETPILTKSTPEGARDYLVPSRTHNGNFFALPQSPQIFKQLLMISGFDRYYQIARCFRDEDLRADRQPEFTQLDVEMSFINEEDIQQLMEQMIRQLFKTVLSVELPDPFPRLTYAESVKRFGTDRPDMRNPLELIELTELMKAVEFKVFHAPANDPHGRVAAICLPEGAELSRKKIDEYTEFVAIYGAKGLAYIKVNAVDQGREGLQSPILKFLPDDIIEQLLKLTQAKPGDLIFFGADKATIVNESLGALREKLCADLNLYQSEWEPLWVTDFPMFQLDKDDRWAALHHPFTAPQQQDPQAVIDNPSTVLSRAYDMVLNGYEIGGGSIRIHQPAMQAAVFNVLGISEGLANTKFGHLMTALKYGCPPHGGIAFGIDRVAMLMTGAHSIREVIAFPKTQSATCPLTDAPSEVHFSQLHELGIKLNKPEKEKLTE